MPVTNYPNYVSLLLWSITELRDLLSMWNMGSSMDLYDP